MSGMLRLFVAVEVPAGVRAALGAVQERFRQRRVRARWTRPENIHLTLKFLGAVPVGHVPSVAGAMQAAAAAHVRFGVSVSGLGVFPGLRRPRVLWAGFRGRSAPLADLQRHLDRQLATLGFPGEARAFRGHLTLARFAAAPEAGLSAALLGEYRDAPFGEFEVRELVLFKSELQTGGPVYTALARAELREGSEV